MKTLLLVLCLSLLAAITGCKTTYGIAAISPAHWTATTAPSAQDWQAFWTEARGYKSQGAHASWNEDAGAVPAVVRVACENGVKPVAVIGIRNITAEQVTVAKAMLAAITRDYQVAVLCIGSEMNYEQPVEQARREAEYAAELLTYIRSIAPTVKLCSVLQYEAPIIQGMEELLRAKVDLLAYTTYPSQTLSDPAQVPANYYARIGSYPTAFTETGWPSADQSKQAAWAQRIKAIKPPKTAFINWTALHDVPFVPEPFGTSGLRTSAGVPRLVASSWF